MSNLETPPNLMTTRLLYLLRSINKSSYVVAKGNTCSVLFIPNLRFNLCSFFVLLKCYSEHIQDKQIQRDDEYYEGENDNDHAEDGL